VRAVEDDSWNSLFSATHAGTTQDPQLSIEVHNFQPLLLQHGHAHRTELRAKRFEFSECLEHVVQLLDIYPRDRDSLYVGYPQQDQFRSFSEALRV
jgi:hypothetical protein